MLYWTIKSFPRISHSQQHAGVQICTASSSAGDSDQSSPAPDSHPQVCCQGVGTLYPGPCKPHYWNALMILFVQYTVPVKWPQLRGWAGHLFLQEMICCQSGVVTWVMCRRTKSPAEVDLMRTSARIAADGICTAMATSRPGVSEHQIAARFGALHHN